MNTLQVPFLAGGGNSFAQVDIANEPWPSGAQKPVVNAQIAHSADAILLKFTVKEKHFKAQFTQTNNPVYKDSCVEFFISLDNNDTYYNFEFNPLGTAYAAYGFPGKRELLPPSLIGHIKISAQHKVMESNALPHHWELIITIPFSLFYKHHIATLKGTTCRANFYKCGDELPEPHFLCWNNITADKPNFHLPQHFGRLVFE